MRAGDLRHTITLQSRRETRDESGQKSLSWINVATVRAKISPVSGREQLLAQAGRAEISHVVSIRYQAQFSNPMEMATMRILYGMRILNITSSRDVDERHLEIDLTCTEGLNEG